MKTQEFIGFVFIFCVLICVFVCGCSVMDKVISDYNAGINDVDVVNVAQPIGEKVGKVFGFGVTAIIAYVLGKKKKGGK